jgi:DNA ligase-1
MLACDSTMERLTSLLSETFLYASYKLDGIRAIVHPSTYQLLSRTLKPIRNTFIREALSSHRLAGVDGELIVGPANVPTTFNTTTSAVMSEAGEPDFIWYIFDIVMSPLVSYDKRLDHLGAYQYYSKNVVVLPQHKVENIDQLMELESAAIRDGFEGLIVRDPRSPYKFGRSTLKQGYMLKLKRFVDSEAVILGFEELYRNQNAPVIDSLGLQRRNVKSDGLVPGNTLGALKVRDIYNIGWEFSIGSGFDTALRDEIWQNQERYINRIVKYKYQPCGTMELPRMPVYKGFRDTSDIDSSGGTR